MISASAFIMTAKTCSQRIDTVRGIHDVAIIQNLAHFDNSTKKNGLSSVLVALRPGYSNMHAAIDGLISSSEPESG